MEKILARCHVVATASSGPGTLWGLWVEASLCALRRDRVRGYPGMELVTDAAYLHGVSLAVDVASWFGNDLDGCHTRTGPWLLGICVEAAWAGHD